MREDRGLIEAVIEETLRYESPVQRIPRTTTRDVEVSGVRIPAGDMVNLYYGSANCAPNESPSSDEVQLDRDLRNHVAFGMAFTTVWGRRSPGAEAKVTLNALLDAFQ
ncbi:MAG: cytochrome P450 [Deltaproteobacteria bacterium]|nr:cytochrome P450 [Deltaproteobacteria bacterium]